MNKEDEKDLFALFLTLLASVLAIYTLFAA